MRETNSRDLLNIKGQFFFNCKQNRLNFRQLISCYWCLSLRPEVLFRSLLMFSGGIERDQWHEMGQNTRDNFKLYSATQKKKKTLTEKHLQACPITHIWNSMNSLFFPWLFVYLKKILWSYCNNLISLQIDRKWSILMNRELSDCRPWNMYTDSR